MHTNWDGPRPIPKKGFKAENVGYPFPNFVLGEHQVPSICRCVFDGDRFYVLNTKDMHILNHNGSFGVSSLTFRGPSEDDSTFFLKPYWAKKIERDARETFFKLIDAEDLPTLPNSVFQRNEKCNNNITMSNGPGQNSRKGFSKRNNSVNTSFKENSRRQKDIIVSMSPCDEEMRKKEEHEEDQEEPIPLETFMQNLRCNNIEEERLILMPEEAIFLSFGVGCLTIQGMGGGPLEYRKVWKRLVETNPEFPICYAVYHYFRSKNWVPKLGDSYGASYLLYKVGPEAYHASYLVHILGFPSRPAPTWNELNSWVRLGCHVSKNVLLCEVSVPTRFDASSSEPKSIFDMSLKETSLFRWKANSGTLIKF